jgi:hemin uptake protein HemP
VHSMSAPTEHDRQRGTDSARKVQETSGPIDSQALFGEAEILVIRHLGLTYTLRKTRNGKLILNK